MFSPVKDGSTSLRGKRGRGEGREGRRKGIGDGRGEDEGEGGEDRRGRQSYFSSFCRSFISLLYRPSSIHLLPSPTLSFIHPDPSSYSSPPLVLFSYSLLLLSPRPLLLILLFFLFSPPPCSSPLSSLIISPSLTLPPSFPTSKPSGQGLHLFRDQEPERKDTQHHHQRAGKMDYGLY